IASVDPLGQRIDYRTDPLGRIIRKILPEEPDEEFSYDANGNLVACENLHIRLKRTFDPEGRMVEERQGENFVIRNRYDETGNRTQRQTEIERGDTTLSHTVKYAYDRLDQPTEITIDSRPPIKIERDAAGQIVAEQLSPAVRRELE